MENIYYNRITELLKDRVNSDTHNAIDWEVLSSNPNAISILERNIDKINWSKLSYNKGVNKLNYQWLKDRMDMIREDLMKAVYHPRRFEYYLEHYDYDIFD